MKIDKAQRAAARHKKTEAIDSFVESQKDEPVHSYPGDNKTLWRSGVVVRNDKNVGHDALQRARDLINSVEAQILTRPKTKTGTNDVWFKNNQSSVEQQIGEKIQLHRNVQTPQPQRDESPAFEHMPVEHYQPQIDDDAEIYVPLSER